MSVSFSRKSAVYAVSVGVVLALGLAMAVAGLAHPSPSAASSASSGLSAAGNPTQQWAFGGSSSASFSCTVTTCATDFGLTSGNVSLSYQYYIEWVVIYTETNVSATQTMVEGQAALNASASVSLSDCIHNLTTGGCDASSLSLSLSGREMALGFTNITTGTVLLIPSGGTVASSVPALAISDSSSSDSFNFSGSYTGSGHTSSGLQTGSISFVIGGMESSSVAFGSPLGIVPVNPMPGDTWNATAPYTGHGSYSSGASITYSINGQSATVGNWTHGTVAPTGTLTVNGTDLGQFTLWDNYTNPPTSSTAQLILLDFGNGAFVGSDGWVLVPAGLYGGALTGIGLTSSGHHGLSPAAGKTPGAGGIAGTTGESAYYQKGVGFIGASAAGNTSIPIGGGAGGPKVSLTAGPEPVSVAQKQYSAITSPSSGGGGGFPLSWLILAVVVVVVAAAAAALVMRRSARRRRPPLASPYTPMGAYPGAVPPPTPPTPGSYPPPPVGPNPGPPGQ